MQWHLWRLLFALRCDRRSKLAAWRVQGSCCSGFGVGSQCWRRHIPDGDMPGFKHAQFLAGYRLSLIGTLSKLFQNVGLSKRLPIRGRRGFGIYHANCWRSSCPTPDSAQPPLLSVFDQNSLSNRRRRGDPATNESIAINGGGEAGSFFAVRSVLNRCSIRFLIEIGRPGPLVLLGC